MPVALKCCSIPGESVSWDSPATNASVGRFVRFPAGTGVLGVQEEFLLGTSSFEYEDAMFLRTPGNTKAATTQRSQSRRPWSSCYRIRPRGGFGVNPKYIAVCFYYILISRVVLPAVLRFIDCIAQNGMTQVKMDIVV